LCVLVIYQASDNGEQVEKYGQSRQRRGQPVSKLGQKGSGGGETAEHDLDYIFTVHGDKSFSTVEFDLKPGQVIVSNGGNMNYMREGIDKGDLSDSGDGGFWSGVGRMFSGQIAFLVKYTGLHSPNRLITFSSSLPGNIMHMKIKPGQELVLNRGSFIACSPNVKISGKLNWRGFLGVGQQEGVVLPRLTCIGEREGRVWIGAFGHFKKHELKSGQTILVDTLRSL